MTLARRTALSLQAGRRPPLPIAAEPQSAAEQRELDAFWLEAALARLSERERTVVELAYYSDLTESANAKRLRVPLLGQIPIDIATREGGDRGMPIAAEDPKSAVGAEFNRIARELLSQLG